MTCLETTAIQLLDSNVHFGIGAADGDNASEDAPEASLSDHKRAAEATGGRFELGEGEDSQIIGTAQGQQLVEGDRVTKVPRLGLELGPPHVDAAGCHAEGAGPRDLGGPRC